MPRSNRPKLAPALATDVRTTDADADARTAGRLRIQQRLALVLILLVAAGARLYRIDEQSLWLDEIWTIEAATGHGSTHLQLPHGEIVTQPVALTSFNDAAPWWHARETTHPPVFQLSLRLWINAFGTSERAVRGFPAAASVIAVYLLYLVVRRLHGTAGPALWAALIMAVAPSQVQFAQEVRPYALMTMVSLAAAWALVSFERGGANSWRLVAFAIALLAMMLTHYFLAGVATALVAYGFLRTRGVARRNLLIAVAIATAVFVLAWGPSMWAQRAAFADENTDFLNDEGPGRVLRTVARVAALPPRLFTEFLGGKTLPSILLGGIVLFAAWLARRRDDLLLWCLWLGGAVGLIALVDLTRATRHLHFLRYTLVAAPALYAIAATLLWPARGIARHLLPGVVMLTCAVMLPAAPLTMWKANWRDLAPLMADQSHPGDILVIAPSDDDLTYPRNAYLCLSHYAPEPLVPFALLQEKADDRLLQQLKGAPGVLLLMPLDATVAPYADVLGECHAEPLAVAIGAGRLWRITWTSERSPAE